MDYLDFQHDKKENDMGYFSRLAAAQQDMRENCLDYQKAFDDLDFSTEMTASMRPYIRAMLSLADDVFNGDKLALDVALHNLHQMQKIFNQTVDDEAERGFDYDREAA